MYRSTNNHKPSASHAQGSTPFTWLSLEPSANLYKARSWLLTFFSNSTKVLIASKPVPHSDRSGACNLIKEHHRLSKIVFCIGAFTVSLCLTLALPCKECIFQWGFNQVLGRVDIREVGYRWFGASWLKWNKFTSTVCHSCCMDTPLGSELLIIRGCNSHIRNSGKEWRPREGHVAAEMKGVQRLMMQWWGNPNCDATQIVWRLDSRFWTFDLHTLLGFESKCNLGCFIQSGKIRRVHSHWTENFVSWG